MKSLSAVLAGLCPVFILALTGTIRQNKTSFYIGGIAAIALCLLLYYLLGKWRHGGLLTLLALGVPCLGYVGVAVCHEIFLPLYSWAGALALLASLFGAVIGGNWSWQGIGLNLAFIAATALAIIAAGNVFSIVCIESGLLAAGAFSITRFCEIDILTGLSSIPRWIYRGLEKLWR